MASLGTLVVNLGANVAPLAKGLSQAQGLLSGFGSKMKAVFLPMTAAAAGAAGAVWTVSSRLSKLAGIADKSVQTGLSGEFLTKLQYAADQSGVSMDTLTASIGKMTVNVGKNSAAFAKLGIDIVALKAMTPEQQFLTVADAISKLPTAADKAAAAVSIFGKSGLEMTGLFADGLKGVNALMAEANRLGIGMTDEALAQAAAADDALQKMWATLGALVDKLVVVMAPAVEAIANQLAEWIGPLNTALNAFLALGDKTAFLKDVLTDAFAVATATIEIKWNEMIQSIIKSTMAAAMKMALLFERGGQKLNAGAQMLENKAVDAAVEAQMRTLVPALGIGTSSAEGRRDRAQTRLDDTLSKLQSPPPAAEPTLPPATQSMQDFLAGMMPQASAIGKTLFGVAANTAGAIASPFMQGQQPPIAEQRQTGAMQRGSAESFSTIIANMNKRSGKSPEVNATEKQTKELLKGFQQILPSAFQVNVVEAFA